MNEQESHRKFSTGCFNEVWTYLEKDQRSLDEDRLMREMAHASLYHWLNRNDCDPTKISIGLWLISRVYAELADGVVAGNYAGECISVSETHSLSPFYLGFAYEAEARAAGVCGDLERKAVYLAKAREALSGIENDQEREMLDGDLKELEDVDS